MRITCPVVLLCEWCGTTGASLKEQLRNSLSTCVSVLYDSNMQYDRAADSM